MPQNIGRFDRSLRASGTVDFAAPDFAGDRVEVILTALMAWLLRG